MVENTGEAVRVGAIKPVNTPEPVQIEEDTSGLPMVLRTKGRQCIIVIDDRWRIDDEWWRPEPVSRLYYAVRVSSGHHLVLYKNLITNNWYRQTY